MWLFLAEKHGVPRESSARLSAEGGKGRPATERPFPRENSSRWRQSHPNFLAAEYGGSSGVSRQIRTTCNSLFLFNLRQFYELSPRLPSSARKQEQLSQPASFHPLRNKAAPALGQLSKAKSGCEKLTIWRPKEGRYNLSVMNSSSLSDESGLPRRRRTSTRPKPRNTAITTAAIPSRSVR